MPTLDYATRKTHIAQAKLATAALTCSLLFVLLVPISTIWHPAIPSVILFLFVFAPPAGLILGIIARKRSGPNPSAIRRRANIAVTLASIEIFLVAAVALLLPTLCRSSESANRVKCGSNLRQIGQALSLYAEAHGGRFPHTLDALLGDNPDLTGAVFVCPSANDTAAPGATPQERARHLRSEPHHLSYIYAAADLPAASVSPNHVLAYEPLANHQNAGMNVLFGDGHVDFVDRKFAEHLIAEVMSGHNPPRAPTTRQ